MPELKTTEFITNENLKAYYRFESGALTTDASGEGHTLTAISDPAEDASGKFGGAVALDGNDAYSAVDHADFKPTSNFTVGLWVKIPDTGATTPYLFQSFSYSTNFAGILIGITGDGLPYIISSKNSGTTVNTDYKILIATSSIDDEAWHFIVATWDGSYIRIYVDGVQEGGDAAWANAPVYAATNYVRVGCGNYTGTNVNFSTGSLDDVFLLNGTAISANQIRSLYEGSSFFQLFN